MLSKSKRYVVSGESVNASHKIIILKQIILAFIAGGGCLNYGFQAGWISPMQKLLQSDKSPSGTPLTDSEMTWVASLMPITGIFAGFFHMYCADAFGRRKTLIIAMIAQVLSWILLVISSHVAALMIARALTGVGASGAFIMTSVFIRETMQSNIRGALATFCYSIQYGGLLTVYVMGSYLSYYTILWICLGFSATAVILFIVVAPETPPFLVKNGKIKEATKVVAALKGVNVDDKNVQKEIEYMVEQDTYFKSTEKVSFITIFKNKAWRRGCYISFVILGAVGFNGAFSIITYAHKIFRWSGVDVNPELQILCLPMIMLCGCIVTLICVDRIGRKPLLALVFLISAVALAVLGSLILMREYQVEYPGFLPVVTIAAIVFAYAMGLISTPHLIMSEMFRFEIRARLICSMTAEAWIMLSVQLIFFDYVSKLAGAYTVFYVYALVNLFTGIFVFIFVPETKGRTPEEIEDMLLGIKNSTCTSI